MSDAYPTTARESGKGKAQALEAASPGLLQVSEAAQGLLVLPPRPVDFDPQAKIDARAEDPLDLLAGLLSDPLQHPAPFPDDDPLLGVLLHIDGGLNVHQARLRPFFHFVYPDRHGVGDLLMHQLEDLFPDNLSHDKMWRLIRRLSRRKETRALREIPQQDLLQQVEVDALGGRDGNHLGCRDQPVTRVDGREKVLLV